MLEKIAFAYFLVATVHFAIFMASGALAIREDAPKRLLVTSIAVLFLMATLWPLLWLAHAALYIVPKFLRGPS